MPEPPKPQGTPTSSVVRPNRRACRRLPPKTSTRVRCHGSAMGLGPNLAESVLDLSERGVRLLLKSGVAPGRELEVNLEAQAGGAFRAVARVVWVVPVGDGRVCAGAEFQKPIPYACLSTFCRV